MEQNIRQYEAENKTGNPVLDTLLTAKTMECQQENITITSVADGRMLGFLTIRELCTIVGVALDNAAPSRTPKNGSSRWRCTVRAALPCCGSSIIQRPPRHWMRTACRSRGRT